MSRTPYMSRTQYRNKPSRGTLSSCFGPGQIRGGSPRRPLCCVSGAHPSKRRRGLAHPSARPRRPAMASAMPMPLPMAKEGASRCRAKGTPSASLKQVSAVRGSSRWTAICPRRLCLYAGGLVRRLPDSYKRHYAPSHANTWPKGTATIAAALWSPSSGKTVSFGCLAAKQGPCR